MIGDDTRKNCINCRNQDIRETDYECITCFCKVDGHKQNPYDGCDNYVRGAFHNIKLNQEFADAVLSGRKNFEVRMNDRDYKEGDRVRFAVVDNLGHFVNHPVDSQIYEITYMLVGWGLEPNYVAFGIKNVTEETRC